MKTTIKPGDTVPQITDTAKSVQPELTVEQIGSINKLALTSYIRAGAAKDKLALLFQDPGMWRVLDMLAMVECEEYAPQEIVRTYRQHQQAMPKHLRPLFEKAEDKVVAGAAKPVLPDCRAITPTLEWLYGTLQEYKAKNAVYTRGDYQVDKARMFLRTKKTYKQAAFLYQALQLFADQPAMCAQLLKAYRTVVLDNSTAFRRNHSFNTLLLPSQQRAGSIFSTKRRTAFKARMEKEITYYEDANYFDQVMSAAFNSYGQGCFRDCMHIFEQYQKQMRQNPARFARAFDDGGFITASSRFNFLGEKPPGSRQILFHSVINNVVEKLKAILAPDDEYVRGVNNTTDVMRAASMEAQVGGVGPGFGFSNTSVLREVSTEAHVGVAGSGFGVAPAPV